MSPLKCLTFLALLATISQCVIIKKPDFTPNRRNQSRQIRQQISTQQQDINDEFSGQSSFLNSPSEVAGSEQIDETQAHEQETQKTRVSKNKAGIKRKQSKEKAKKAEVNSSSRKVIKITEEPISAINTDDDHDDGGIDNERKWAGPMKKPKSKGKEPLLIINANDESDGYAADDAIDACKKCINFQKVDGIFYQMKESMKETQTIIVELDNQMKSVPIDLEKPRSSMSRVDQDQNSDKIISTGNAINSAIIGLYLSFLPIYNGSDEMNLQRFNRPKINKAINVLCGQNELVKDDLLSYFEAVEYRLLAENDQPTKIQLKNIKEIFLNVLSKNKGHPFAAGENVQFNNKLTNIKLYTNFYAEMLKMLIEQTKISSVINSTPNLFVMFGKIVSLVDTFLDDFHKASSNLCQNVSSGVPSSVNTVYISSDSEETDKAERDESSSAMACSAYGDDKQQPMESSREGKSADNDQQAKSGDDQQQQMMMMIRSRSEMEKQNLENTKKLQNLSMQTKNECVKCAERVQIQRMVEQLQKNHRQNLSQMIRELSSTKRKEILKFEIVIGTVIYGIKITLAAISVRTGLNESSMDETLEHMSTISDGLVGMSERIEKKLMEFLKTSKIFLLADSNSEEETALIKAETTKLEEFIANYHAPKASKNDKIGKKLHNVQFCRYFFQQMCQLLESLANSSLMQIEASRKVWQQLIKFTESFEFKLKQFAKV